MAAFLDASRSTSIEEASWQCFEMEALTELPDAVAPTLLAIFHRLEKAFTGAPSLLILDEAWLFLEDSLFAAQIKAWLKTLRKKNISVLFATQSLADIEQSNIAATLIDACPQKIFLPNERAREALLEGFYRRFGLNDRQLDLIAEGLGLDPASVGFFFLLVVGRHPYIERLGLEACIRSSGPTGICT